MSAITAKASRKMKKYAVLTREPRCFLGSFDFSWEQRKFDEVFDCTVPNNTLSRAELSYDEGTVLNVHYGDVLIKYGSVLDVQKDDIPRIPHRCREDFNGALLQDGDVIIADTAEDETTGKACEIGNLQGSAIVSGLHTMVCRPRNRMALGYLGYYLNSNAYHYQLLPLMQGIKVLSLSRSNIQKTSVSYPIAVKEQQLIAYYFRQLDNLITLHQRKCALLFSSFQALISMMFTTSTFSWEQRKVSDLAEKTYGGGTPTTSNEAYWNGDIPWIQSSDVVDGKLLGVEPRKWITQDGLNNSAAQLIPGNSIAIITRVGVGKLAFMPYSYATSQDFLSLSKLNAEPLFTVYACYKKLQSELNAVQGTSIKGITKDELLAKNIMVPRYAEQQQIGAFFKQLDHLITLHQRKCISFTVRAGRLISTVNKKRITSSWEQRKLGELVDRVVRKNTNNESTLPLTISAQYGLVDQITYFNNRVASRDVSNYYLVLNGEFAYNKSTSDGYPFGAVKRLDLYEKGVLSTLYIVFAPKKEQQIDSDYLTVFFDTDRWHKGVAERAAEGARNHGLLNISAEDFFDIDLSVPKDIVEQKQIGAFIRQLDNLITLHQRKPFLMKWRTSDANRNQTNRLVL